MKRGSPVERGTVRARAAILVQQFSTHTMFGLPSGFVVQVPL